MEPMEPRMTRRLKGALTRKEEGYAFVKFPQFTDAIFASKAESLAEDWDELKYGQHVRCHVSFTRRGPRATNLRAS